MSTASTLTVSTQLLATIGNARSCTAADNIRLVKAGLLRNAGDGWVDLTPEAKLQLCRAGYAVHPILGWVTPAQVASYIEVGDSEASTLGSGPGVVPGFEVVSVDQEFGLVRVRYTTGVLKGEEDSRSACSPAFMDIVRRRRNQKATARALEICRMVCEAEGAYA